MHALKSFIDGQGRRIKPGDEMPDDYDAQTLAHYQHHGMVGQSAEAQKPARPGKREKPVTTSPAVPPLIGPSETKPAAPEETKTGAGLDLHPAAAGPNDDGPASAAPAAAA